MNSEVVEVQVRAVLPLEGSFAVFMGNSEKVFVIYVDETVGAAISMFMRGVNKERPLTHDLISLILMGFGAKVERVIINHMKGSVFHARLIITAENQLHNKKVVELDARPSDSIALAVQQNAPIYVSADVWNAVEDMTETLEKIEKQGQEAKEAATAQDDDENEIEDLSDAEIDAIANQSGIQPEGESYDDGYRGTDEDDEEGEEWKKDG
ncbi:MAG: bifunctional nuclease family protein [Prosthecobacter sp.]